MYSQQVNGGGNNRPAFCVPEYK